MYLFKIEHKGNSEAIFSEVDILKIIFFDEVKFLLETC